MGRPFVDLPHVRARQQPDAPLLLPELVDLFGGKDRPAKPRLDRRDSDHREVRHADPRTSAEERPGRIDRLEGHDVAVCAALCVPPHQAVAVDAGQRDRQRRRGDTFRLDDRQARHAPAGERETVHANVTLLKLGAAGRGIDDGLGADGHWRREPGGFERQRQRSSGDQRSYGRRLTRGGGLMPRENLCDSQPPRADDLEAFGKPVACLGRGHANHRISARGRHSLDAVHARIGGDRRTSSRNGDRVEGRWIQVRRERHAIAGHGHTCRRGHQARREEGCGPDEIAEPRRERRRVVGSTPQPALGVATFGRAEKVGERRQLAGRWRPAAPHTICREFRRQWTVRHEKVDVGSQIVFEQRGERCRRGRQSDVGSAWPGGTRFRHAQLQPVGKPVVGLEIGDIDDQHARAAHEVRIDRGVGDAPHHQPRASVPGGDVLDGAPRGGLVAGDQAHEHVQARETGRQYARLPRTDDHGRALRARCARRARRGKRRGECQRKRLEDRPGEGV